MSASEFAKLGQSNGLDRFGVSAGTQPTALPSGLYAVGSDATKPLGTSAPIAAQPRIANDMDTIETYSKMLAIDKHALDQELLMHSDVMFRIIEAKTRADRHVDEDDEAVKRAYAQAFLRAKAVGTGDKGPSEAVAKEHAKLDPLHATALVSLSGTTAEAARWAGLLEAWKQKGHALRELVSLYQAQYFSLDPASRREPAKPRTDYSDPANRPSRRSAR